MLKLLFFAFAVTLVMATIAGCDKTHNIPALRNIDLSTKHLSEVKAIVNGKWQLHYMQGGFCGTCQYQRHNESYAFGNDGSTINWTIDKTVWADASIAWFQQEWNNKQI